VSQLEGAESSVSFLQRFWCCLHPLNRVFSMHLVVFDCVRSSGSETYHFSEKTEVLYLSRVTSQCVLKLSSLSSDRLHCNRWRRSSTSAWHSRVTEGRTRKENTVLHELYHFALTKREFSAIAKISVLKFLRPGLRFLYDPAPVLVWSWQNDKRLPKIVRHFETS